MLETADPKEYGDGYRDCANELKAHIRWSLRDRAATPDQHD